MEVIQSLAGRNAHLNCVRDAIDAGAGRGLLKIYTGVRPNDPDKAPSATAVLLATLVFTKPSGPDAENGRLRFNSLSPEANAPAAGRASWARIADSEGRPVCDVDVTGVGGGGIVELDGDGPDIAAGGVVGVNSFELSA